MCFCLRIVTVVLCCFGTIAIFKKILGSCSHYSFISYCNLFTDTLSTWQRFLIVFDTFITVWHCCIFLCGRNLFGYNPGWLLEVEYVALEILKMRMSHRPSCLFCILFKYVFINMTRMLPFQNKLLSAATILKKCFITECYLGWKLSDIELCMYDRMSIVTLVEFLKIKLWK